MYPRRGFNEADVDAMKRKVLILEDEIIIANSIQLHVEANGYDAKIATDTFDAEILFRELLFDIVLCDINLNHQIEPD